MRALALDMGEVRVGVAVSDATGCLASPVCVLPAEELISGGRRWRYILEDYEPDVLVVGLPQTLAGEVGPQAERVMVQAQTLANTYELPLEFVDERLSSREARRILREEGLSEREMRGRVDMVAASLFLQSWLDAKQMTKG